MDKQRLIDLLEPPLASLGYELVDLDLHVGGKGLLRLYIDNEAGVRLADCELVSGQIGALLDVEDPIPGNYTFEVSSPGIDRPLRTLGHFERFAGQEARLELKRPQDGRKRFKGRIEAVDGRAIVLDIDGEIRRIELDDVATARLAPEHGVVRDSTRRDSKGQDSKSRAGSG